MEKIREKILAYIGTIIIIIITSSYPTVFYADDIKKKISKLAYSDEYLQGYFNSIFENELGIAKDVVTVKNNIIILNQSYIDKNTSESPSVILNKTKEIANKFGLSKNVYLKKNLKVNPKATNKKIRRESMPDDNYNAILMPGNGLFDPLIADPKWPRFTLAYQYNFRDKYSKNAFAPNFGASFSLFKLSTVDNYYNVDVGVQAGLFSILDIGHTPTTLINADYYIAVPITYQNGKFSSLIRGYHLSSHLGDEFMLTEEGTKIKRINLSYEGIDLLGSFKLNEFRIYGGGGYIVHKDPSYIKRGKVQFGAEYKSHKTFWNDRLRSVFGIDIKLQELQNWYPGISCKVGVQLENRIKFNSSKIIAMLEYFRGKSIHGQLYNNKTQYLGVGIHAFL